MLVFIKNGTLGALKLGLSRAEVLKIAGIPQSWAGKPPAWGPVAHTLDDSDVWSYNDGSPNVYFTPFGRLAALGVSARAIARKPPLFEDWPDPSAWTIRDFISWAWDRGIEVERVDASTFPRWVAAGRCLLSAEPLEVMKKDSPWIEKRVGYLQVFENFDDLEYKVKFEKYSWTSND